LSAVYVFIQKTYASVKLNAKRLTRNATTNRFTRRSFSEGGPTVLPAEALAKAGHLSTVNCHLSTRFRCRNKTPKKIAAFSSGYLSIKEKNFLLMRSQTLSA